MSDIKLFQLPDTNNGVSDNQDVIELVSKTAKFEKDLQMQIEQNMEVFLGIRFLVSEYSTGKTHKGRIDSLGLDENNCPVIIEYKRHSNENVINQGLFYLDWLLDHQAEFRWLVMDKFGKEIAENIEWSGTRLVCIASYFNKYDEHAIAQIHRNIELMRYSYFGEKLLLLELVNATSSSSTLNNVHTSSLPIINISTKTNSNSENKTERKDTHEARIQQADSNLMALYNVVCEFSDSLGDDVQRKELKFYTAFKSIKNFVSIQVWAPKQDPSLRLYMNFNPEKIDLIEGKVTDVRDKGHWGTGNLEVIVRNIDDLELAKKLIEKSYQEN